MKREKYIMHTNINNMSYENYDPCYPDQPVVDQYLPIWANQPSFWSKPAFIWAKEAGSHESLTYSQLNSSVQTISSNLLIPLKRRDTVLILCSPGLQLVQILFGCQRAGLLSVPILPSYPSLTKEKNQNQNHLIRVLLQTKPKAAIAHQDYITAVRSCISSSSTDNRLRDLLQKLMWISVDDIVGKMGSSRSNSSSSSSSYIGCKPDEVYLVQYTSGATNIPKPVLVTTGSAGHNVRTARKAYDLQPSSVIVSWLPQYHDCGLMFLLLTVVTGATCVLTSPDSFVKRPRLWLELITEFKASCTPVPSFALPLVLRRGGGTSPINLWSLRNLIIINEPIYRASIEEFIDEFAPLGLNPSCISPSYGLAENCTFVSTAWRNSNPAHSFPNIPSYNKLLPSARLSSTTSESEEEDTDIIVVNEETFEPVDDGIEGEIWISSPSNALGYLGYPSLTRENFHGRLQNRVSRSFVRTGDRGIVIGEERYLFVMGRSSDVIKVQKDREIHPHYIETTAYKSFPKLLRGGCIAAFEISKIIVVVAELQRSEGDVRVLRRVCEGIKEVVLKEEKVEVGLVVLVKSGSIPKTTSGKIQRWVAKYKLMRGEMSSIVSQHGRVVGSFVSIGEAKKGERKEDEGGRRMVVRENEEHDLSCSNSPNGLPLMSFL